MQQSSRNESGAVAGAREAAAREARAAERESSWDVMPHGEIEALDEGLWCVSGVIRLPVGAFPRRMTIVRLADGRLVIYSAIALDEPHQRQLEALGEPAFLIVPNEHHRRDAAAWKARYPEMLVCAPPGSRDRIEDKVAVDTTQPRFDDEAVSWLTVRGTRDHEVALRVTRPGGVTLVVNDVIANIRESHGFGGWLLRRMGFAGDEPHVPAPIRLTLAKEKTELRQQLLEWAELPALRRVVVAHGDLIEHDAAIALQSLAASLE